MSLFQFHKGTIRTKRFDNKMRDDLQFQFHKGTIRTFRMILLITVLILFQFHKGTIRTDAEEVEKQRKQISIP